MNARLEVVRVTVLSACLLDSGSRSLLALMVTGFRLAASWPLGGSLAPIVLHTMTWLTTVEAEVSFGAAAILLFRQAWHTAEAVLTILTGTGTLVTRRLVS